MNTEVLADFYLQKIRQRKRRTDVREQGVIGGNALLISTSP